VVGMLRMIEIRVIKKVMVEVVKTNQFDAKEQHKRVHDVFGILEIQKVTVMNILSRYLLLKSHQGQAPLS